MTVRCVQAVLHANRLKLRIVGTWLLLIAYGTAAVSYVAAHLGQ